MFLFIYAFFFIHFANRLFFSICFFFPSYILFICAVKISNWNFSICFHVVTKENFSNDVKVAKELASFHTKTRNRQAELIVSRTQVRENERNMEENERDREKKQQIFHFVAFIKSKLLPKIWNTSNQIQEETEITMRKKYEERQTRNKIGVMIFYFIQIRTKLLYTIVNSIFIRYRILAMKNWADYFGKRE